jgi:hypothetical protein
MLEVVSSYFKYGRDRIYIQTRESHDIFTRVRGREQMNDTIMPTMPKTIEQVPWLVMVFIATVKVNRWLAMTKIRKMVCATPRISRPHFPARTSPASAIVEM